MFREIYKMLQKVTEKSKLIHLLFKDIHLL